MTRWKRELRPDPRLRNSEALELFIERNSQCTHRNIEARWMKSAQHVRKLVAKHGRFHGEGKDLAVIHRDYMILTASLPPIRLPG